MASSLAGGVASLHRKSNLEWDPSTDLGVPWTKGDLAISNQREAANRLEGIEKDLIDNYSNYLPREDPEGKPSKKPGPSGKVYSGTVFLER